MNATADRLLTYAETCEFIASHNVDMTAKQIAASSLTDREVFEWAENIRVNQAAQQARQDTLLAEVATTVKAATTQAAHLLLADLIRTFGILDTTELLSEAARTVAQESEDDDAELLRFAAGALTSTAAAINKA